MIFEDGTMDYDRYIKEVFLAALKFGNDMFATDWTFLQRHTFIQSHRHGVLNTFLVSSAGNIDPQTVLI